MSHIYPRIGSERKVKEGQCQTCKVALSQNNQGTTFDVQYSYFRGEDELETYCRKHAHEFRQKLQANIRKIEDRRDRARQQQDKKKSSLLERLADRYEVILLTPYQWRINGVLDVYPTNRLYHDLKRNKRGGYNDVLSFCAKFFDPLSNSLPH